MAFEADDLAAVLADAGEDLWLGADRTQAVVDEGDTIMQDAAGTDMPVRGTLARIATGSLPAVAVESTVRWRDTAYRVRRILFEGDGRTTLLVLAKV